MYQYSELDKQILNDRVALFKDQTERYLDGQLAEDEFLPLRLQNGLYVQRYAPMMRIAVPYGLMSSKQLRVLAQISRDYDKGYVHVSTRQNIQINWPELSEVPEILEKLAEVEMHANQTSGNCIRNVTSNQFAGVDKDEIEDPRPWCEIIRQWSTYHPEFAFLPRKFKIAVSANKTVDRAVVKAHDIGLYLRHKDGQTGFEVLVGGGLGRTPIIGQTVENFIPYQDILAYLEAILRVYNRHGRRDNKYKARIKILVKALGVDAFREKVEAEFELLKGGSLTLDADYVEKMAQYFTKPAYEVAENLPQVLLDALDDKTFKRWYQRNVHEHMQTGYAIVTVNTKETARAPGDVSDYELEQLADLADRYCFGQIRSTHDQNFVLADVRQDQLPELYATLKSLGFADPTIGLINDIICCPGGDFCALANAKSIPIAESIQRQFDDLDYVFDIGELELNISGCMNACGHHHVGNIGILGVDKKGEEFYQIQLGGNSGLNASLAKVLGPALKAEEMPGAVQTLIDVFLEHRQNDEQFIDTYERIGMNPFKERIYAQS